jgi:hypothetical protein
MHESGIDRNAVKPSGERGVSAEGAQFAERLDESFLGKVVRVCWIVGHPETNCIDSALMVLKQGGKRITIAFKRPLDESGFGLDVAQPVGPLFDGRWSCPSLIHGLKVRPYHGGAYQARPVFV